MIKLSEIASYIIEQTKHSKDLRYVKGLLWEQLELSKYNKLLNEIKVNK